MATSDADRWNDRYSSSAAPMVLQPPEIVTTHLDGIGEGHRTLDVACGWGDAGLHLATLGATATLTDVSSVALAAVAERAVALGVEAETIAADLENEPVPVGAWDAITCLHYLDRVLLPRLGVALAPGGRLACAIATTTNLERHERPSARFLVDPGELPTLIPGPRRDPLQRSVAGKRSPRGVGRGVALEKRAQHGSELCLGFFEFGLWVALGDNTNTCCDVRCRTIDLRGADRHCELAVALSVEPARWAAITSAIKPLELCDRCEGIRLWVATHCGRWVYGLHQL